MAREEDILQELRNINQNLSRQSPFAYGGATGAQMASQLASGTQSLVSSTGQMLQGSYNVKQAIDTVSKALNIFPTVGPALAGIITATSNELLSMNNSMIMAGRNGVTFSQNLFAYTKMLGDAGISFQNFNSLLQNSNKYIMGFGLNAQDSAENFLKISAALKNTDAVLAARLTGIDFEEFQQSLLVSTNLMKFVDGKRADSNRLLADSAYAATIAIDDMARITGKSRQEIQKDVDKASQSRLMQVAKMSMDQEQLDAIQRTLPFFTQFGDSVADVYQQLEAFGEVVTPEAKNALAGFNQAFPGIEAKMREMVGTLDPTRRKEIEMEIQYLMAQRASDKQGLEELRILATRKEPWAVDLTNALINSQALSAGARARFQESGGDFGEFVRLTKASSELRQKIQEDIGKLNQQGGVGAIISQILRGLDVSIQAGSNAVANYVASFEKATGEKLGNVDVQGFVNKIMSLQQTEPEKVKDIVKAMMGDTSINLKEAQEKGEAPNVPRYKGQSVADPLYVNVVNGGDLGKPRFGGTKGMDGDTKISKWFEDFGAGTLIQAHNREGIIREDQSTEFALDTLSESGILGTMAASLKGAISANQNPAMMRDLISKIETIPQQLRFPDMPKTVADTEDKKILADMLDRLNSKLDKLITVVEDGSRGTVKAVKNQGNLIG